ncbi:hypothetical protein ACFQBQ_04070 [Granulicella cerasi]|uniref:Transmembrane protein n=1 Tax=Granulicella cerasi TaxID=741063 RepID=A0ABW1Z6I7_9BACT|nr:hypothetical protein [Granulicella cerasi]
MAFSHGLAASMILLGVLVVFGIFLLPKIFYILTLQKALAKCAPTSRTMEPMMFWIFLIPLVDIVFHFFMVMAMTQSLRNEFALRGIYPPEPELGQTLGIATCVAACCMVIPFLGTLAFVAYLVLWIMYWMKIANFSRFLDAPIVVPVYPQQ